MADNNIPVLIPRRRVSELTGLERSALYERIARGAFPSPIRVGSAAVRWIEAEVVEWVEQRIAASRKTLDAEKDRVKMSTRRAARKQGAAS